MALWQAVGLQPFGSWYFEAGLGMKKTLAIANKQEAYVLVDRGTWLASRQSTGLAALVEKDPLLLNPYHIMAVSHAKYPSVNYTGAKVFIGWVTSAKGQKIIGSFKVGNEYLFETIEQVNSKQ